jgi:hypothetical protein
LLRYGSLLASRKLLNLFPQRRIKWHADLPASLHRKISVEPTFDATLQRPT